MKTVPIVGLILNYRDAARSVDCIRSLLSQPVDCVVVWDNSADDGYSLANILLSFKGDSRVVSVLSPDNIGFAAGVNRGLSVCVKQFPDAMILLLNNDARLLPGAVEKLGDVLCKHDEAVLAYPDIDHGLEVRGASYYQYWSGLLFWSPRVGCFSYASGCCLLVAPHRIELPLFDESFFMYGEDWELGWRLRGRPGAMLHLRETLVEHEGAASSGLGSPFYEERMVASHLILARKLSGNNLAVRYLLYFFRTTMLLSRAAVRSLRFRSLVPFAALWRGWRIAFIYDSMKLLH